MGHSRIVRRLSSLFLVPFVLTFSAFMPRVQGAPPPQAGRSAPALPIEEKVIVAGPFNNVGEIALLPDGKSIVYCRRENKQWKIFINGQGVGEPADRISAPVVSEDELHSAFALSRGGRSVIVVDGQERGEIDWLRKAGIDYQVGHPPLVFSTDGRNVAYAGVKFPSQQSVRALVVGQAPGPEYDTVGSVAVSSGSPARLAYNASKAGKNLIVLDGAESPGATDLDIALMKLAKDQGGAVINPTFSPDGAHFAYFIRRSVEIKIVDKNGREKPDPMFLLPLASVVDGKEIVEQIGDCTNFILSRFIFSPGGKRVAYAIASLGTVTDSGPVEIKATVEGRVTVDGEQGPIYSYTGAIPYAVEIGADILGNSPFPLIKKTINPSWMPVSAPVFSPDSRHVAYVAHKGPREVAVVVDGAVQSVLPYEKPLSDPQYSPDGRHLACVCWDKGRAIIVMDGQPTANVPASDANFVQSLTFSPDGGRLAFVLERLGGTATAWHTVVVDGKPQKEYESMPVTGLMFSPDGRHVAYLVTQGGFSSGSRLVIDGQEGPKYRKIWPATMSFSPTGDLAFTAMDKKGLLQVLLRDQ